MVRANKALPAAGILLRISEGLHLKAKLIVLTLAIVGSFSVHTLLRANPTGASSNVNEAAELDVLDQVVQKRFHNVIGFGMARIATERQFIPESREEKEAVNQLKRADYEICFYLAGRGILQDIKERDRVSHSHFGNSWGHTMSGPVFLSDRKLKALPDARVMWEPARQAFRNFSEGASRYSFEANGWQIEARPVRVSAESCLRCHGYDTLITYPPEGGTSYMKDKERNNLRVGDPVGILLYVHKQKK